MNNKMNQWGIKGWVLCCCLSLLVGGMLDVAHARDPVGKRVKLLLHSGLEVTGILLVSNEKEVQMQTVSGIETFAAEDVKWAIVTKDQPKHQPSRVRFVPGRASYHSWGIFSLGLGPDAGVGAELMYYEYISKSGLALKVSPLNITSKDAESGYETNSFPSYYGSSYSSSYNYPLYTYTENYTPLWVRYYFRDPSARVRPLIGVGLSFRESHIEGSYGTRREESGWALGKEVGIDFGGRRVRSFLTAKYFSGEDIDDTDTLLFINMGLALRWAAE